MSVIDKRYDLLSEHMMGSDVALQDFRPSRAQVPSYITITLGPTL